MSKQTIRKSKPKNKYMTLPNKTAQNDKLSYEALGMLTYIQSLPDDWTIHASTLRRPGCGRDKVYRILAELISSGYAKRETIYNEKHQIVSVNYEVSDNPEFLSDTENPQLEANPLPENPYTEKPDTENPQLQRNIENKEIENKDSFADKPQVAEKKDKPRDRLFDGIALVCFGIKADDPAQKPTLDANASRIGQLVKYLKSVGSTPEKLWLFKSWYCKKYPDTALPQDLAKFSKHYNDFLQDGQAAAPLAQSMTELSSYAAELRSLKGIE